MPPFGIETSLFPSTKNIYSLKISRIHNFPLISISHRPVLINEGSKPSNDPFAVFLPRSIGSGYRLRVARLALNKNMIKTDIRNRKDRHFKDKCFPKFINCVPSKAQDTGRRKRKDCPFLLCVCCCSNSIILSLLYPLWCLSQEISAVWTVS